MYSLGLELVQLINLFSHFGDGVVVLLAQICKRRLVLDVSLLQISAELAHLGFSLLVELDLGRCGTTGFFQSFAQLFQFTGKVSTLFLSLKTSVISQMEIYFELKG